MSSKKNPLWPEGVEKGEECHYCLRSKETGEIAEEFPDICFKDGVYYCDTSVDENPYAPYIQEMAHLLNHLYQVEEERIRKNDHENDSDD